MPDGIHTFEYAPEVDCEPTVTIAQAVSEVKGQGVTDLTPLATVLDTDELNRTFSSSLSIRGPDRSPDRAGGVWSSFEYEGCSITVEFGRIMIEEQ